MNGVKAWLELLDGGAGAPPLAVIAAALLFAFAAGQVVAWIYMWTHTGISYSRAYVQSLVLIALIVALIMVIVGSNVVVAFGLVGAMAVIRFRNVLKDTRDTAFIFMELAVGLGSGTGNFLAVAAGTVAFGVVMAYLHGTGFGTRQLHDALLRIVAAPDSRDDVEKLLYRHCHRHRLVSVRSGPSRGEEDLSFRLLLRDPERSEEFVRDLEACSRLRDVSLLLHQDETEV
ncbi:DUF4956 domain-containing protein [Candidatus Poribacteria bacterium]|nr:DUF4956 domain-containing protein [Candidatus Poribacteria bacterium]